MRISNIMWNIWLFVLAATTAAGYTIAFIFKSDVLVWTVTLLLILLLCCTQVVRAETRTRDPVPSPVQALAPAATTATTPFSIIIIQNPHDNLSIGYLQEPTVKLNNPMRANNTCTTHDDHDDPL